MKRATREWLALPDELRRGNPLSRRSCHQASGSIRRPLGRSSSRCRSRGPRSSTIETSLTKVTVAVVSIGSGERPATLPANQPAIQPGSGIHAVRTALPLARPRTGPDEQQRQPIVTRHVWELPSGTLVEEQWTADSADFADRTTKNTKGTKGECHFVSFVLFVVFRACFSTTDESASIILFGCGRRQRWVISAPNRHRSEAALSRSG